MLIEIETDYDNSTNKTKRFLVRDSGYVVKNNLTLTAAKTLKRKIEKAKNVNSDLRRMGVKNTQNMSSYGWGKY